MQEHLAGAGLDKNFKLDMIKLFLIILTLAFWAGQTMSLNLGIGIRIIPLDLAVGLFGLWNLLHLNYKDRVGYWHIFGSFVAVAVLSLVWQIGKLNITQVFASSMYLVRFGFYSLLFTIFSQPIFAKWGKLLLLINGLGVAAISFFQLFLYPNLRNLSYLGWDPHQYRIFSTFLDPNFTGIILVLTLFLGFELLRQNKHTNMLLHRFVFLALGLAFIALLFTYSRGSYIAFLFGVFVWLMFKRKVKLFLLIGALFISLLFFLPKPDGEGVNLLRTISVEARWKNNLEAINLWRTSPLIGVGFNTLRFVRTEAFGETQARSGAGFHNSWLYLLAATGILGLMSYSMIWQKIIINKIKGKLFSEKNTLFLASLTAVAVHSLFDNSLFYPAVMYFGFILAGSLSSDHSGL